jgi:molecular chaperone DnaJ
VRITGAGHAGGPGAPDGDLYVEVRVAEDPRFRRDGDDLVAVVGLPATDAMLGTSIEVETLDGPRTVEVEAGTQPGTETVLRGLGLPRLGGGRRGDQRVILNVIVPGKLSEQQRELAERLGETLGPDNLAEDRGGGFFSRMRRAFG